MAAKGIEVSPSLLAGLVVVILGLATWTILGTKDKDSGDNLAVATATPSATPSPSTSPTATATPKPTPASGWVRYNLAATGVSFDYPKTLSSVTVSDEDFAKMKEGTGHQVTGTFKLSSSETDYSLSLLSETLDFTTGLGRGGGFTDLDGFEKSGSSFKTYTYNWEDGKKNVSSPLASSSTAEAVTTAGGFEALVVTGGGSEDDGPGTLLKNQYGAIVMLPVKTGYHAVSLQTAVGKMSKADFTTLVKSFDLAN